MQATKNIKKIGFPFIGALLLLTMLIVTMLSKTTAVNASGTPIITGILDGTLPEGKPKAVEIYIQGSVNLSGYQLWRSTNGDPFANVGALSGVYTDEFVYLTSTATEFADVFGSSGDFANVIVNSFISGNGNDGFQLRASDGVTVIDQVWEANSSNSYQDSYMYRVDGTAADGGWIEANWTIPGNNTLDGMNASQIEAEVPFGTYVPTGASGRFSISKSAPTIVDPSEVFTYTITLVNNTGITTTGTIITDVVPTNANFISASDGGIETGGVVSWTIAGDFVSGASIERTFMVTATASTGTAIVNAVYGAQATNWMTSTMGSATTTTTTFTDACDAPYTPIYDIQGSGTASPIVGNLVATEGVVTAVFQDTNQANGFYIQDAIGDGLDNTSDGILVYTSTVVSTGDVVRVAATVSEYSEITELTSVSSILPCSTGATITPTAVSLPIPSLDLWEQYEGMVVEFSQGLYVTEHYLLGRYGQLSLSINDRLYNPTNIAAPGAPALAQQELNDRSRVVLDDTYTDQNHDPIIYPGAGLSYTNTVRGGDYVANLVGVVDGFNSWYHIQPTGAVEFTAANPRTAAAEDVGGDLTIASFNVLNYFNGNGSGGGFPTARGADTLSEFNRQHIKIVNAIVAMDADIIGLMEIENDGYGSSSAIQELVDGLNDATAAGTYAFINPGAPIGSDQIAVGLLYKPASVTLAGSFKILDDSVDSTFNEGKNRPVLTQSFTDNISGETVTVAVNHLKSKGSSCASIGDPDAGDGQGNCNGTRTIAATALINWLATDPTSSGSSYNIIIGDLNAYAMEDPITTIKAAGYDNLLFEFGGLYAYSYVFDGQHGYLDHALSSTSLTPFITGATTWHINSDEPISLDYNEEYKTPAQHISLYGEGPYRASDHDPVIVGVSFTPQTFTYTYLPMITK